jgi:hypothetical protein
MKVNADYTIEELNEFFYIKGSDLLRKKKSPLAHNLKLHTPLRTLVGEVGEKYYSCKFKNKPLKVHRLIYELHTGKKIQNGFVIDHINGDTLDNRIENLRCVIKRENNKNTKVYSNNTTGQMGITMDKNRFRARIWDNGKCISKSFGTMEEAVKWRRDKLVVHNFLPEHGSR